MLQRPSGWVLYRHSRYSQPVHLVHAYDIGFGSLHFDFCKITVLKDVFSRNLLKNYAKKSSEKDI